ncbi:MAG: homoserine dehydrogenase [Desulfovibrionaceae bacterium]|nr:homoserine dehydrogenase [Desulfovibrionaceae bacterium]
MKKRIIRLGIAGIGTVGSGLVRLLDENREEILQRTGCAFQIGKVAVRDVSRPRAIPEGAVLTDSIQDLIEDPELDIVVELMGGLNDAQRLVRGCLERGRHVVTANKALLAEKGEELFAIAAEHGAALRYEASVAGGIPIVQTLKESLSGNRILSIEGILNGTSNYILSAMTENDVDFVKALGDAQKKGYAEADPTLDIDGFDTAHKLVLLIRLAWGEDYPFASMPISGIRNIANMDISFANAFGYCIKLLGSARKHPDGRIDAGVYPVLVPHSAMMARVNGAFNAVHVVGNAVGDLFLHGAGAGSLPTASAVLADLIAVVRASDTLNSGFIRQVPLAASICPEDETKSRYYFRFMVKDDPGVLSGIAGSFADEGVSIAQAIQQEQRPNCCAVPLIFMTHEAQTSAVRRALNAVRSRSCLREEPVCYHVL